MQAPITGQAMGRLSQQVEPCAAANGRIDQLFMRFQAAYGHIWTSRYPTLELIRAAKAEWADGLAVCSDQRLFAGFERCRQQYPKPPTLPEFIVCCLPTCADFGLPDFEAAYHEACGKAHEPNSPSVVWSHPAVYWAGKQVGWRDLHCGLTGVRCRFEKAYQQLCKRVMSGEQLSFPTVSAKALEHKGGVKTRTEQEKQTAQQWLSKIKQGLGSHGHV